jgi:hypothetical protein
LTVATTYTTFMSSAVPLGAQMAPVRFSPAGTEGTGGAMYCPDFGSKIFGRMSSSADLLAENFSGQPKYAVPP